MRLKKNKKKEKKKFLIFKKIKTVKVLFPSIP